MYINFFIKKYYKLKKKYQKNFENLNITKIKF